MFTLNKLVSGKFVIRRDLGLDHSTFSKKRAIRKKEVFLKKKDFGLTNRHLGSFKWVAAILFYFGLLPCWTIWTILTIK